MIGEAKYLTVCARINVDGHIRDRKCRPILLRY